MKAIILSAGQGTRLHPYTKDRPKCLAPIGGIPILEWQVKALTEAGVKDFVVVIGAMADKVRAIGDDLKARYGLNSLVFLYNPFFDVADNLVSCWMARDHMKGPFLIANGDTVFSGDIAEKLISSMEHPVTLAHDVKPSYDDDDMKTVIRDGKLWAVSKRLPEEEVNGESIGFMAFTEEGGRLFVAALEDMMTGDDGRRRYYLFVIDRLAKDGHVGVANINGLPWSEFDFPEDIEQADELFVPRLVAPRPFTAILLAGQRNADDPVAKAGKTRNKVFVKVGGRPMIHYVLEALADSGNVNRIVVATDDAAAIEADPCVAAIRGKVEVLTIECAHSPVHSVLKAYDAHCQNANVLVSAADNPLLTAETVRDFTDQAYTKTADMLVALASGEAIAGLKTGLRRTTYNFSDVSVSSCNLFALTNERALEAVRHWAQVEKNRKSVWRVVSTFGVLNFTRMFFNRLSLRDAFTRASAIVGCRVSPVIVGDAASALDVDKPEHLDVAEALMGRRA